VLFDSETVRWLIGTAFAGLFALLGWGIRILWSKLDRQDTALSGIESKVTSLDQKVGLDLRGLDVRLSFIEGQLGIKK
jgi:hypothetical protein